MIWRYRPALSHGKHLLELKSSCPLPLGKHSVVCHNHPTPSPVVLQTLTPAQVTNNYSQNMLLPSFMLRALCLWPCESVTPTRLQRIFISITSCNSHLNVKRKLRQGFSGWKLQLLQVLPCKRGFKASLSHNTDNLNPQGNFSSRYSGIKIVENTTSLGNIAVVLLHILPAVQYPASK